MPLTARIIGATRITRVKEKHNIAKAILSELWAEREGILSTQVLQEFYVIVPRRIPSPLSNDLARLVVNYYAIWCMETTPMEISAPFHAEDGSQIGFWDSMIVSSAARSRSTRILSEYLNGGQYIAG